MLVGVLAGDARRPPRRPPWSPARRAARWRRSEIDQRGEIDISMLFGGPAATIGRPPFDTDFNPRKTAKQRSALSAPRAGTAMTSLSSRAAAAVASVAALAGVAISSAAADTPPAPAWTTSSTGEDEASAGAATIAAQVAELAGQPHTVLESRERDGVYWGCKA